MGYWFVMGPGGPFYEDVEPAELDSGQLRLDDGHTLPAGSWTKRCCDGGKPDVSRTGDDSRSSNDSV